MYINPINTHKVCMVCLLCPYYIQDLARKAGRKMLYISCVGAAISVQL